MTTIAVTTFKGGVGKTTTARDLSAALSQRGHRVLALDLDRTQRHLMKFADGLPDVDFKAVTAGRLGGLVAKNQDKPLYDFIVVDCPPALEKEAKAALQVADIVVAPVQPEYLAADGLGSLMRAVEVARDARFGNSNPHLQAKVLITMFDRRDSSQVLIESAIRAQFGGAVATDTIKRHPSFTAAALVGQSILDSSPRSQGAQVYKALAAQIIDAQKARANGTR